MKDLSEIKAIRRKLGLTQTELARKSGVSQSLIAKIESGSLEPTYSKARKIFDTLELLAKRKALKAREIMNRKVILARPDERIHAVIRKMRKEGISQMPVSDSGTIIGLVTESLLLDMIVSSGPDGLVGDAMGESPPMVSEASDIEAVTDLLKHFPLVLVVEKGKLKGIITKSDILGRYVK